ncbi:MAG: hypothetical protein IKH21_09675, partial [Clostridia bacterium]|nr:hypothetical protein [Clostridia bacterium]
PLLRISVRDIFKSISPFSLFFCPPSYSIGTTNARFSSHAFFDFTEIYRVFCPSLCHSPLNRAFSTRQKAHTALKYMPESPVKFQIHAHIFPQSPEKQKKLALIFQICII